MPVAPTYNPSYSGGRDQEDRGLKPAGQTVFKTLSRKKKKSQKGRGWRRGGSVEWLKVQALSYQYHKKTELLSANSPVLSYSSSAKQVCGGVLGAPKQIMFHLPFSSTRFMLVTDACNSFKEKNLPGAGSGGAQSLRQRLGGLQFEASLGKK
jgi:hypothetical protein